MNMRLHIIGTSHIAKQSINEIKEAFKQEKPDLVAVELDAGRAQALLQSQHRRLLWRDLFALGIKGFLFAKIGQYIQQKLGQSVGVAPGAEMKTALELAQQHKLKIALIDQPIQTTLRNLSKQLTWKEKWRFLADIFKGIFFPKSQLRELGLESFDLKKVPEDKLILRMMSQLQLRYPSVYQVLVEERNKYMVKKLVYLLREHPKEKILVVVGAGHKAGMEELLLKVDVVD